MLLTVVLFAYSQGIVSSRAIERACREHVSFIVLSGDKRPELCPEGNPLGGHHDCRLRLRTGGRHRVALQPGPPERRSRGGNPKAQLLGSLSTGGLGPLYILIAPA